MIICPFMFVVVLGDIGTIHDILKLMIFSSADWSPDPVHGGDGPQNALWPGTPAYPWEAANLDDCFGYYHFLIYFFQLYVYIYYICIYRWQFHGYTAYPIWIT